jgi:hypothetical protein
MLYMSPLLFRILTIASVLFSFVGQYINLRLLPGRSFVDLPLTSVHSGPLFHALAVLILVAGLVSSAGLLLFKSWARMLNLATTVAGLVVYPMVEYFVSAGLKVSTDELSALLGGAVLAAAYWSPISARFGPSTPSADGAL